MARSMFFSSTTLVMLLPLFTVVQASDIQEVTVDPDGKISKFDGATSRFSESPETAKVLQGVSALLELHKKDNAKKRHDVMDEVMHSIQGVLEHHQTDNAKKKAMRGEDMTEPQSNSEEPEEASKASPPSFEQVGEVVKMQQGKVVQVGQDEVADSASKSKGIMSSLSRFVGEYKASKKGEGKSIIRTQVQTQPSLEEVGEVVTAQESKGIMSSLSRFVGEYKASKSGQGKSIIRTQVPPADTASPSLEEVGEVASAQQGKAADSAQNSKGIMKSVTRFVSDYKDSKRGTGKSIVRTEASK